MPLQLGIKYLDFKYVLFLGSQSKVAEALNVFVLGRSENLCFSFHYLILIVKSNGIWVHHELRSQRLEGKTIFIKFFILFDDSIDSLGFLHWQQNNNKQENGMIPGGLKINFVKIGSFNRTNRKYIDILFYGSSDKLKRWNGYFGFVAYIVLATMHISILKPYIHIYNIYISCYCTAEIIAITIWCVRGHLKINFLLCNYFACVCVEFGLCDERFEWEKTARIENNG